MHQTKAVLTAMAVIGIAAGSARATFHIMQIEQVIGGVNGDTTAQAVQLRQRAFGQNLVSQGRIRAWDAAGANPVLLIDFPSNVANPSAGTRILVTTAGFNGLTSPMTVPDFAMTTPIPPAYLAAGSLTFEDSFGTVYWRLSWGGASYTGATTGNITNDADGQFGPAFSGALPSSGVDALKFQGAASAASTSNAGDYALTIGGSVWTKNNGTSYSLAAPATGACCDDLTGTCNDPVEQDACLSGGGRFGGENSTCATIDPPCLATGACCDDISGTCEEGVTGGACKDSGRRYGGDASACATIDPACVPAPRGACCVPLLGTCIDELTLGQCDARGGAYGGDQSTCATITPECKPVLSIALTPVAGGLVSPVRVTHAGDGSGRLFIVDQAGVVRIVDSSGSLLATPFLDVTASMVTVNPGFDERGLLGLAFHPNYAVNGRFFVRYSVPRAGVTGEPCFGTSRGCHLERLSEFHVSGDPNIADPGSEVVLFNVDEPEFNHNSGTVAFGPDGFLYFTLGDGGGRDDGLSNASQPHGPIGNGQNIDTPLGSMIRIDVDSAPAPGLAYAIPADNPFVGGPGLDEIYAYGFRNPFTFAFDDSPGGDGTLYLGDVGQELFEEQNIVIKGGNYGWVIREGAHCFDPTNPNVPPVSCPTVGTMLGDPLIDPVSEYLQPVSCLTDADCAPLGVGCGVNGLCLDEGGISTIIGGVYRASGVPPLVGKLVYGDFSSGFAVADGRLYYFDVTGPDAFERRQFFLAPDNAPLGRFLKGFGKDEAGELYVCVSSALAPTGTTGEVLRITQPLPSVLDLAPRYLAVTLPNGPDPVRLLVTCPGGISSYVGAPVGPNRIAKLADAPAGSAFLTPAEWGGTVNITGVDITPDTSYTVALDFGALGSPAITDSVTATTTRWGDVAGPFMYGAWSAPDGSVDVTADILAILDRFVGRSFAPSVPRVDLIGAGQTGPDCGPDGLIDILDILTGLDAFRGLSYTASTGCPTYCP